MCEKSQKILCKLLFGEVLLLCQSLSQLAAASQWEWVCCAHLLGPWAVCPHWGSSQPSPSSVPSALLFLRIFNLCNSVACAGYSIFYQNTVLRKAAFHSSSCCLCLFLPSTTTNLMFINSCLGNEPLPLYSSWVQLPFLLAHKMWTLGFFLILFYYTEYCHFKRHIQQQQMFLFILFLLCDNCSWLRVFSPSPHTSCESSPGDATRRLSSLSLAKNELKTNKQTKQREHWVKNDLNSKYKK